MHPRSDPLTEAWELVNNYSGGVTPRGVALGLFPEVSQDVQWGMHRCPQCSLLTNTGLVSTICPLASASWGLQTLAHIHTARTQLPCTHPHVCTHSPSHTHTCIHTHAPMCHTCQVVRNIQNKTLAPNAQSTQQLPVLNLSVGFSSKSWFWALESVSTRDLANTLEAGLVKATPPPWAGPVCTGHRPW